MDPAYFSAFAALAGSAIGGLTSLAASWLNHHVQFRAEQETRDLSRREDLYRAFVEEASKRYADAYEHETAKVSDLVNLYALVSRMRVLSSWAPRWPRGLRASCSTSACRVRAAWICSTS